MNIYAILMYFIWLFFLLVGCSTQEAYIDAAVVRQNATDFYSDEILENLIRASNKLLFLHVDLQTMQAIVADKLTAQVGGGQTLNNTSTRQTSVGGMLAKGVVGIVTTATQLAVRPFTFTVSPERDNTIQLVLAPAFGNLDNVYNYYIQFLNFKSPTQAWKLASSAPFPPLDFTNIRSLESTDASNPPNAGSYVPGTLKRWGGRYYYIPKAYRQKYFELGLMLMQRPTPAQESAIEQQISRNKTQIRDLQIRQNSFIQPSFPP
jgi:hypothetical protein